MTNNHIFATLLNVFLHWPFGWALLAMTILACGAAFYEERDQ